MIRDLFFASGERFGVRPIRQRLKQQGYEISERRIRRLMQEMELIPISQREVSHYYNPASNYNKHDISDRYVKRLRIAGKILLHVFLL